MRSAPLWAWGVAALLGTVGVLAQAQDKPTAQRQPTLDEIKVEDLPSGSEREEWEVIQRRHPHAHQPAWVLKRGWGPPPGCTGPFGPQHCFIRICPENGALTLDWAQVFLRGREVVRYVEGKGPDRLPREVLQAPKITPEDAWSRVMQAVKALGAGATVDYSHVGEPVLRLVQDERRLRLAYRYRISNSHWLVSVDALTGDVGGTALSFIGAQGFDLRDPFLVLSWRHWVPTKPPVK